MSMASDQRRMSQLGLVWASAVLMLLAGAGLNWWQSGRDQAHVGAPLLSGLKESLDEIATITIRTGQGSFSLQKTGDQWVMPQRDGHPVNTQAVSQLLTTLAAVGDGQKRTSDPSLFDALSVANPEEFGDGTRIILVDTAQQRKAEVLIGQRGRTFYIRKAGEAQVYRGQGPMPPLPSPAAWLDLAFAPIDPENIRAIRSLKADQPFEITRRADGGFAPVGGQGNANATALALALSDFAPQDAARDTAQADAPSLAALAYELANRQTIEIDVIGLQVDGGWVRLSARAAPDASASVRQSVQAFSARTNGWLYFLPTRAIGNFLFDARAVIEGPSEGALGPTTLESED